MGISFLAIPIANSLEKKCFCRVVTNDVLSWKEDVSNGLLQGSIFGPVSLSKNSVNHIDDENKE